jgi:hypothetical protein
MILFVGILAMGVIGFFIHLFVSKKPITWPRIVELLLLYQLVFSLGFASLLSFIGLAFLPRLVAEYLGWPFCPFQHELANVNLGYSVLGFMCIWYRENFWLATVIGASIWLIGDGIGHVIDAYINNNYAPGNVGIPLYTDFIVPFIMLMLLQEYRRFYPSKKS